MKLKKLTIHNIASIENAVIDFEQEPMASGDLFLITGETGAGKSTILDAICLALYSKTPRLGGNDKRDKTVVSDDDKKLPPHDPANFLRQNTVEGFAEVSFLGSDSIEYTARWLIKRARGKIDGKIQKVQWTLENHSSGVTLNRVREVETEINKAIGLDFSQFCRTVMLAQGDFTLFLKSDVSEKADILEKITGMDIYSRIGKKIYELKAVSDGELNRLKERVSNLDVLTDEARQELVERRAAIDVEKAEADKILAVLNQKKSWLETNHKLETEIAQAQAQLAVALEFVNSDEFKSVVRDVEAWTQSVVARKCLSDIDKQNASIDKYEASLKKSADYFARFLGGRELMDADIKKFESEKAEIEAFISSQESKKSLYENLQAVRILADSYLKMSSEHADKQKKLAEDAKSLDIVVAKIVRFNEQLERDNASNLAIEEKIKNLQAEVDSLDLSALDGKRAEADARIRRLETAERILGEYVSAFKRRAERKSEIDHLSELIANVEMSLAKKCEARDKSLTECEAAKAIFEQQKQLTSQWMVEARSRLTVGCKCPVCRQEVRDVDFRDEKFDEIVQCAKNVYEQHENAYKQLNKECSDLGNDKKVHERTLALRHREYDEDKAVERAVQAFANVCDAPLDGADTAALMSEIKSEIESERERLAAIAETISKGNKLKNDIDKFMKDSRLVQVAISKLKDEIGRASVSEASLKAAIEQGGARIKELTASIRDSHDSILEKLGDGCDADTVFSDLERYMANIQNEARVYALKIEERDNLKARHVAAQTALAEVDGAIDRLVRLCPGLAGVAAAAPVSIPDLSAKLGALYDDINTVQNQIVTARKLIDDNRTTIDRYCAENADATLDELKRLDSLSASFIEEKKSNVEHARNNLAAQKDNVQRIEKEQKTHSFARPSFDTGEDDTNVLTEKLSTMASRVEELIKEQGGVAQRLATDDENLRRIGDFKVEIDAKTVENEKWTSLAKMLGDREGKTFRKIAQSYVLANLIQIANHYLASLTDRYSLKVDPGSFNIEIVDSYQGNAVRSCTTLSGGESFLVSLALALGLSDLGNNAWVDTLFIDEGFGTLSGEPLLAAIDTLRSLHSRFHRRVGIISHVETLRERIPLQIRVTRHPGHSASTLQIHPTPTSVDE